MKIRQRKNIFESFETKVIPLKDRTIEEILIEDCSIDKDLHKYTNVSITGVEIPKDYYQRVRPKDSAILMVQVVPQGGNFGNIARTIALITVAVAITALNPAAGLGFTSAFATGLVNAAIIAGASLAINALIPPTKPSLGSFDAIAGDVASGTDVITGQGNQVRVNAPVTKIYGLVRNFPNVASLPYTEISGQGENQVSFFYNVFDVGVGEYEIGTFKLGETALDEFDDVTVNVVYTDTSDDFELYNVGRGDLFTDAVGTSLNNDGDEAVRTTQIESEKLQVILQFPQGLRGVNASGGSTFNYVDLAFSFRENGTTTYIPLSFENFDAVVGVSNVFVAPFNVTIIPTIQNLNFVGGGQGLNNLPTVESWQNIYTGNEFRVFIDGTGNPFGNNQFLEIFGIRYDITNVVVLGVNNFRITLAQNFEYTISGGNDEDPFLLPQAVGTVFTNSDNIRIESNQESSFFVSLDLTLPNVGEWDLRIERIFTNNTGSFDNFTDITWNVLKSFKNSDIDIISTEKKHTFVELKIKATDQLSGQVGDFNCTAHSILPYYDGVDWSNKKATSNPAWIFADILTGELNQRAISKDRLDTNSLLTYEAFCEQIRNVTVQDFDDDNTFKHESNFSINGGETIRELLSKVTNATRASLNLFGSKYGVIIDEQNNIPTQVFTNRNIVSFSSSRSYTTIPDAFRVKFINRSKNYTVDDAVAFNDGFDETNAETIEEIESYGITNIVQAVAYGRYMLAQAKLRQETVNIEIDIENLACSRGDLVLWQNDAMLQGGFPSRIKEIIGNEIVIDADFGSAFDSCQVRKNDGSIVTKAITSVTGANSFNVSDSTGFEVGNLIIIGFQNEVTQKYIVKSIEPNSDLSASLVLVEYNENVYNAENEFLTDYDPNLTAPNQDDSPPTEVELIAEFDSDNRICSLETNTFSYNVFLSWIYTGQVFAETYEVYVSIDNQAYELATVTEASNYTYSVLQDNIGLEHDFKVLGVSGTGAKLSLDSVSEQTVVINPSSIPFFDVESFNSNIVNEVLELSWPPVNECGLDGYVIRYTPSLDTNISWAETYPIATVDRRNSSVNVNARTGQYLIKAVDVVGGESANAKRITTSIPSTVNLNFISEVNDFPNFGGTPQNTIIEDGTIRLGQIGSGLFPSTGTYAYSELFDLGTISQARYTSKIQAFGFNPRSIMSEWLDLTDAFVPTMTQVGSADWSVSVQVRGASFLDTIGDWVTLSSITQMSFGAGSDFTEWRTFTSGDFTFRFAQFRLLLQSFSGFSTPVITDGLIEIDMPDRIYSQNDIQTTDTVLRVDYSPYFYLKPVLSISYESADAGDHYIIENHDETGFEITFLDLQEQPIPAVFDFLAKGFGYQNVNII